MSSRKKKTPVRSERKWSDFDEYQQMSALVPAMSPKAPEYVHAGPSSPLWHKRMGELTVLRAQGGDTKAALEILRNFVGVVDQFSEQTWPGPIDWAYAQYIAGAFERIIRASMRSSTWSDAKWGDVETGEAQADANLALGIKSSKPGRRKGRTAHNEEALAAALNLLVLNGLAPKQAKLHLYELTGAVPRTIERANKAHVGYQMYAEHAMNPKTSAEDRDFASEVIKVGAAPLAAKIQAILAARKGR